MEKVALSNVQLDHLAFCHPNLKKYFRGTRACDRMPRTLNKDYPEAFIVNTDPHDKPGTHWIAIWIDGSTCEILDSFAMPFKIHPDSMPLQQWLERHFDSYRVNTMPLQSIQSDSCGDYALYYLIDKSNGYDMEHFLNHFKEGDFVWNDHHVGQLLKNFIRNSIAQKQWKDISDKPYNQRNK